MNPKRVSSLAAAALVAAFALSGCTASLSATVDPDDVASVAEDALEAQVGTRPLIDCGDEPFPLEVDASRTCVLTDPLSDSDVEYDAEVTITAVDGTDISVSVQVADVPRN